MIGLNVGVSKWLETLPLFDNSVSRKHSNHNYIDFEDMPRV